MTRAEIEERLRAIQEERKQDSADQRELQINKPPPVVGSPGPDLHVLVGRADRIERKARRVATTPGASMRMSDADIDKQERQNFGAGLEPFTPGIDRFKSQQRPPVSAAPSVPADPFRPSFRPSPAPSPAGTAPAAPTPDPFAPPKTSADPARMQSAVANAARAFDGGAASVDAFARPSVRDRVEKIGADLKPGEHIGIREATFKEGGEMAGAVKNGDGSLAVAAEKIAPGTLPPTGKVRDPYGTWKPIQEETARIAKPHNDALDRAQRGAEETAGFIQRNQDENSALRTAAAVDAFQTAQSQRAAAAEANRKAVASIRAAQASPGYNPSRDQIERQNAITQQAASDPFRPTIPRRPRAKSIAGI